MTEIGRPPATSPEGYKTIQEAMAIQGVSYPVVYSAVRKKRVRSKRNDRGEILIREDDVKLIEKCEPTPPGERSRIHVYLTPNTERHAQWERAAAAHNESVSEMAYRLMDRAARCFVRPSSKRS